VPASFIQFDEFSLDCDRYELLRSGRPVKLEKIPMELLILLATKDGHLVARDEIIERLWGKDVFVDTEHGINTAVRKIRLALKDDPEKPRFVQTVTGKGYRFVAQRRNGADVGHNPVAEQLTPERVVESAGATSQSRMLWRLASVTAALLVVAGAVLALNLAGVRDRVFAKQPVGPIHSIAVLPMANLSGDLSQDYYADGMTDELTTALARNRSLRVVSRTSAMQFKGVNRPLHELAQSLGVDGVLEGSVNRSGNDVHINLQLIYAPTDTHVWAHSYDRDLNSAMSLPEEVSQTIAAAARVDSTPARPQRTISPEAHEAYLRGRYLWFASDDNEGSRKYFEKAIQLQPDYAAAWSGLADSYGAQAVGWQAPPPQLMVKVEQAARHALELDDSVPEAHNSLAAFYLFWKWDLKSADAESTRALELNPNFAEAHYLHAYVLMAMQRPDEALLEAKRSSELDPLSRPWGVGYVLIRLHRLDDAIEDLKLKAAAQPKDPYIRLNLSDAYWLKGMWADSVHEAKEGFLIDGDRKSAQEVSRAFDSAGWKAVAEWWVKHSKSQNVNGYVSPLSMSLAYAQARNKEETFKYLQQAYAERSSKLVFLQNNPVFDFLHSDERYRALVRRMGLPPAWNERSQLVSEAR
jgi:TolB-like protein/DNA-binding winged helix-turn-helix (wHTH) protein